MAKTKKHPIWLTGKVLGQNQAQGIIRLGLASGEQVFVTGEGLKAVTLSDIEFGDSLGIYGYLRESTFPFVKFIDVPEKVPSVVTLEQRLHRLLGEQKREWLGARRSALARAVTSKTFVASYGKGQEDEISFLRPWQMVQARSVANGAIMHQKSSHQVQKTPLMSGLAKYGETVGGAVYIVNPATIPYATLSQSPEMDADFQRLETRLRARDAVLSAQDEEQREMTQIALKRRLDTASVSFWGEQYKDGLLQTAQVVVPWTLSNMAGRMLGQMLGAMPSYTAIPKEDMDIGASLKLTSLHEVSHVHTPFQDRQFFALKEEIFADCLSSLLYVQETQDLSPVRALMYQRSGAVLGFNRTHRTGEALQSLIGLLEAGTLDLSDEKVSFEELKDLAKSYAEKYAGSYDVYLQHVEEMVEYQDKFNQHYSNGGSRAELEKFWRKEIENSEMRPALRQEVVKGLQILSDHFYTATDLEKEPVRERLVTSCLQSIEDFFQIVGQEIPDTFSEQEREELSLRLRVRYLNVLYQQSATAPTEEKSFQKLCGRMSDEIVKSYVALEEGERLRKYRPSGISAWEWRKLGQPQSGLGIDYGRFDTDTAPEINLTPSSFEQEMAVNLYVQEECYHALLFSRNVSRMREIVTSLNKQNVTKEKKRQLIATFPEFSYYEKLEYAQRKAHSLYVDAVFSGVPLTQDQHELAQRLMPGSFKKGNWEFSSEKLLKNYQRIHDVREKKSLTLYAKPQIKGLRPS